MGGGDAQVWNDLIYVGAAAPLIIAIFVAIAVWRSASSQRTRRALQEGLSSADPAVRCATLDAVDEVDLSRNAQVFVRFLGTERDPDVLDALAAAVARSRWEPTDNGNIVELRRWVAGRHAHAALDDVEPRRLAADDVDAHGAKVLDDVTAGGAPGDPPKDDDARDGDPTRDEDATFAPEHREPQRAHLAVAGVTALAMSKSSATAVIDGDDTDITALVPKVREVLGDDLARVELVSIDGRVLATWSSGEVRAPELN